MTQTSKNPFDKEATSQAYSNTDYVYRLSSEAIVDFVKPNKDQLVIDIGAGTGISSEIILKAGAESLYVVEPSRAMLSEAEKRLGDQAKYIFSPVENLIEHFDNNVDLAYAVNSFHLFQDLSKALADLACILKDGGVFVFNLSAPTYGSQSSSENEVAVIKANKKFYEDLNEVAPNEIISHTIYLLEQILNNNYAQVYTKEKIALLFSSVGLTLEESKEITLQVPQAYQRNIWSMMAKSFITDDSLSQKIIDNIELPELITIRQGLFKLKNNI